MPPWGADLCGVPRPPSPFTPMKCPDTGTSLSPQGPCTPCPHHHEAPHKGSLDKFLPLWLSQAVPKYNQLHGHLPLCGGRRGQLALGVPPDPLTVSPQHHHPSTIPMPQRMRSPSWHPRLARGDGDRTPAAKHSWKGETAGGGGGSWLWSQPQCEGGLGLLQGLPSASGCSWELHGLHDHDPGAPRCPLDHGAMLCPSPKRASRDSLGLRRTPGGSLAPRGAPVPPSTLGE